MQTLASTSHALSVKEGVYYTKNPSLNFQHTVTQTCPCGKTKRNTLEHFKEFHLFRKERNEAK